MSNEKSDLQQLLDSLNALNRTLREATQQTRRNFNLSTVTTITNPFNPIAPTIPTQKPHPESFTVVKLNQGTDGLTATVDKPIAYSVLTPVVEVAEMELNQKGFAQVLGEDMQDSMLDPSLLLPAQRSSKFPPPPLVSGTSSPPMVTTSPDSLQIQCDGESSGYETRESTESIIIQSLIDAHRVFHAMTLSGYFSLTNGSLQFKHWDPGVNKATEKHSLVGNLQSFPKKDGNTAVGFIGVQPVWNFNGAIEPLRAEFDVKETPLQIYGQFSDCSISESSKFFISGSLSDGHHMYVEMPHRTVVDAPIPDTEPHDPGPLKSPSLTVAIYLPRYASKIISPVCGSVVTAQGMVEPIYYVYPKHYNPIFLKFVLDITVRTLGPYTAYLITPYTLPKLDIISIPAFVARNSWVFQHVVPFLLKGEVKLQILNTLVKELETILDMSKPFTSPLPLLAATRQLIIHGVSHVCYEDDDGTTLIKIWTKVYRVQILDTAHANSYNPEQPPSELITASKSGRQVGFRGLGAMGFGMATHLLRWNFCVFGNDIYALTQIRFAKNGGMIGNPPQLLSKGHSKIVSYVSSTPGSVLQILGLFSSLPAPMMKLYVSFSMSCIIAPMHTTCFAIAPSLSPTVSVSKMAHVPIAYATAASNAVGLFHGVGSTWYKNEPREEGDQSSSRVIKYVLTSVVISYNMILNFLPRAKSINTSSECPNGMYQSVTESCSMGFVIKLSLITGWALLLKGKWIEKEFQFLLWRRNRFLSAIFESLCKTLLRTSILSNVLAFDLEDKISFEEGGNDTMVSGWQNRTGLPTEHTRPKRSIRRPTCFTQLVSCN